MLLWSRLAETSWGYCKCDSDLCNLFDTFYESLKDAILDICFVSPSNRKSKLGFLLNPPMTSGLFSSSSIRKQISGGPFSMLAP